MTNDAKTQHDIHDATRELLASIAAIDFSYKTSDFLPGDKERRFWAAVKAAKVALNDAEDEQEREDEASRVGLSDPRHPDYYTPAERAERHTEFLDSL